MTIENGEVTTAEKSTCGNLSLTACDSLIFNPSPESWFNFDSSTGTITGFSDEWYEITDPNINKTDITMPCQINGVAVINIGSGAFNGQNLTSLVINDNIITINPGSFNNNNNLSKLIIGENVTTIGVAAFNTNKLNELIIPDSVTYIDNGSFANNQLTKLTLGNNVATINAGAFANNQLTDVYIPGSITNISWDTIFDGNNITSLKIGNGITSIPSGAFQGDEYKLLYVEIPGSVETIGSGAFYNQSIKGYEGIKELVLGEGIKVIEAGAFDSNQLTNIIIPSTVTTIGSSAFGNNELTEVVIPGSVQLIDSGAFINNAIETLVLEEGIQKINGGAFVNNKIKELTIPSSIVLIGNGSFSVNNLNSIIINSQDAEIQLGAFNKANGSNTNLTTVYNNSGKSYDWNQIINSNTSTDEYTFESGIVVNELGNVMVKKPPVRVLENKQYSTGDAIENYGGYNWHVIGDDGENVTLIMDGGEMGNLSLPQDPNGNLSNGNMMHCTNDLDANTDCGVDSTGTTYVYSWDKSLVQEYLNTILYNELKTKIDNNIIPAKVCNDPSVYDSSETTKSYGGWIENEIISINGSCANYSNYNIRLITESEFYNISPHYNGITLPYTSEWDKKAAKIESITRQTWEQFSWLLSNAGTMSCMSSLTGKYLSNVIRSNAISVGGGYWFSMDGHSPLMINPVITVKK